MENIPAPPVAPASQGPHSTALAAPHPQAHPHAYPAPPYWASAPPYRPVPAWVMARSRRPPRVLPFRAREILATVVAIVAFDLATWGAGAPGSGGWGLGILFLVVPLALLVGARAWRASPRLSVVAALLGAVAVRCVILPTSGTVVAGLALLLAFALSLRARRAFVPEAFASALAAVGKLPSRVSALSDGIARLAAKTRLGRVSLLPIVVPTLLCGVFLGVFALANPLVAHGLGATWDAIAKVVALPAPLRVLFWLFAAAGALLLLRPAQRLARGTEAAASTGDATPTSLLVARNALVGLNVLFLAYNALDAAYLWSGAPPSGMRTQQYAHEGAFWLTVALVLLTAVVGLLFRGALAHDARGGLPRALAFGWMAQGIVLGFGTYRRIAIHIASSGLSDLRIVGILGTTLVLVGVVLVAQKLRARRTFTWLVRRQLDAFAVMAVLYTVAPTHWLSARVNVSRLASGEYRPLLHMFRQSREAESAAVLVPLLEHPDLRVRQGVAALLEQSRTTLRQDAESEHTWRERDLTRRRTLAALDGAAPRIDEVLGTVDRGAARQVLLEISRVAAEGRSLEELLAIPTAEAWSRGASYRGDL